MFGFINASDSPLPTKPAAPEPKQDDDESSILVPIVAWTENILAITPIVFDIGRIIMAVAVLAGSIYCLWAR